MFAARSTAQKSAAYIKKVILQIVVIVRLWELSSISSTYLKKSSQKAREKMKVKICEKCPFCVRKTWTQRYEPKGYHAIGMVHAYAYCKFYKARVRDVKGCKKVV